MEDSLEGTWETLLKGVMKGDRCICKYIYVTANQLLWGATPITEAPKHHHLILKGSRQGVP